MTANRTSLPRMIVGLWILALSVGVWRHCQETVQVPIYDAFSYYEKAHAVWGAIEKHRLVNPLNLPPVERPPGTLLMSFPLGFSGDFHAFYFRSVIFPILLLVLAVYIAGWERGLNSAEEWVLALTAVFLSTLPFF